MPAASYPLPIAQVREPNSSSPSGRAQHKGSPAGQQHSSAVQEAYSSREPDVDLFKQQFKLTAIVGAKTFDLSSLVVQMTWQESSSDQYTAANTSFPLTGQLQLSKPALSQYAQLQSKLMSASLDKNSQPRWGALGMGVRCDVGIGRSFVPLWAMRVMPTDSSTGAEQVTLADGTWTLSLADGIQLANQTIDDFLVIKGKQTHTKGWRCDEVAVAVCRQMGIPIKRLVKGTARLSLSAKDTTATSPIAVIANAYQQETNRTGKTFIIHWSAPDRKHPMGALEIVPMRRNPSLLRLRKQLTDAVLTRSQSPNFATVLLGRANQKAAHGKNAHLTYLATNSTAIKRFGWVHKIVDFPPVSSLLELEMMTKRALAMYLTSVRAAELTHPGIATVRRGDAIRVDLPEEGYAQVSSNAYGTPKPRRGGGTTAAVLQAAETLEPSLFGLPDGTALSATGSAQAAASTATSAFQPLLVPIADQGIVFVVSVVHTVSAGSYSMDLQTQYIDVLDPLTVKAQMEATIRDAKSLNRASNSSSGSGSGSGATGSGSKWLVTASAEVSGGTGACRPIQDDGYSELSSVPMGVGSDFAALGHLPCLTPMVITNPANGKSVTTVKQDVGAGSSFLPVMGLYPNTRTLLGLDNSGQYKVIIQRADGGPLKPVRGTPA